MKIKKLIQGSFLLIVSIILTFAALEAMLYVVGEGLSIYPERVQFGFPNPASLAPEYESDPDLIWVPAEYERRLAVQVPFIVFMGDSCIQISDIPARFASQMNVSFINAGVVGYTSYQGLIQLVRDIAPLKPKIITFYYRWNDHWQGFGMSDRQVVSMIHQPLAKYRLGQLILKAVSKRSDTLRVPIDEFKENLQNMICYTRSRNITPVLITAPTTHREGYEPEYLSERWMSNLSQLVSIHNEYADAVRSVAASTVTVLCDAKAEFEKLSFEKRASLMLEDGIHFTPAGNQYMVNLLESCLEYNGLIARGSSDSRK